MSMTQSISSPHRARAAKSTRFLIKHWPYTLAGLLIIVAVILYVGALHLLNSTILGSYTATTDNPSVAAATHSQTKLIIGVNGDVPPLSFMRDGQLSGFEIDMGRAIARELNMPVEFATYDYNAALKDDAIGSPNPLTQNQVDMVISGMPSNRLLESFFLFSNPYLQTGQIAAVKKSGALISSVGELEGKRLAVITDSTGHDFASSITAAGNIVVAEDVEVAKRAVVEGRADAFITQDFHLPQILTADSNLQANAERLTFEQYGIIMMRGNTHLANEVNAALERLQRKGVMESLQRKWFNSLAY
jgi:ABC-type amino acid transport substrate-binding protein